MVHNSSQNFMTTETLSRSVAGSMFHTCAVDPAKAEKASRIMQLLIDNFGVTRVFGRQNIEYFTETTSIEVDLIEPFQYQYSVDDALHPTDDGKRVDVVLARLHSICKADKNGHNGDRFHGGSPTLAKNSNRNMQESDREGNLLVTSTLSVPEVSQVLSPEVTKFQQPKSVEDNLSEALNNALPKPTLGRYNSIKHKQLERLRQRSDWFLESSSQVIDISSFLTHAEEPSPQQTPAHELVQKKSSRNSVTQAKLEETLLEVYSDGNSVYSEETSCIESLASEPVRTSNAALYIHRDVLNNDTIDDVIRDLDDKTGNDKEIPDDEMKVQER